MEKCLRKWHTVLKPDRYCILILGDASSELKDGNLPERISSIATREVGGFLHVHDHTEAIPNERRVRRGLTGSTSETILILRKEHSRGKAGA
jgi:hypothetical protein